MTPSLGVNLRVTGHCNQGGRKYMEGKMAMMFKLFSALLSTMAVILFQLSYSANLPFSDVFSVAYQQTNDEKDLEYAFFGIFDGHGGREAAQYSKVFNINILNITRLKNITILKILFRS